MKCVEGYHLEKTAGAVVPEYLSLACTDGDLAWLADNAECKKDGLSTGLIVLIVLLVIIFLLIVLLIPLCYYCCIKKQDEEEEAEKDLEMRPQSAICISSSNRVMVSGKTDAETSSQIGNSNPFKVSGFNDYIRTMASNKNEGFIREFRSICVGSDTKKIVSQLSENFEKNRYGNITTYDHSQVRLLKINNDRHS